MVDGKARFSRRVEGVGTYARKDVGRFHGEPRAVPAQP